MLRWFLRRSKPSDGPSSAPQGTQVAERPRTDPAPAEAPAPASGAPAAAAQARLDIPHDKIAARAAEIWYRKGKPHGQDFQNWVEAEAELRAELANAAPEPLPRKPR